MPRPQGASEKDYFLQAIEGRLDDNKVNEHLYPTMKQVLEVVVREGWCGKPQLVPWAKAAQKHILTNRTTLHEIRYWFYWYCRQPEPGYVAALKQPADMIFKYKQIIKNIHDGAGGLQPQETGEPTDPYEFWCLALWQEWYQYPPTSDICHVAEWLQSKDPWLIKKAQLITTYRATEPRSNEENYACRKYREHLKTR